MERRHHKNKCEPCFEKCDTSVTCEPKKKCSKKKKCQKPCPVVKCQDPCAKQKKCHKKCKSSSSNNECCLPKVVYVLCKCGTTATMSLSATVQTPNGTVPPYTYTCPTQVGQKIYITFTVTNTGNATIKGPIYVYDSFTGVHRITCTKLRVGETESITVHGKITKCDCQSNNSINITANSFSYACGQCLILVSQPIAIQITQTPLIL
ncbi:MAG TPA: hypothetical protein VLG50_06670 [Candidatus Saccharimonadales bacterium]|nr:hypothetical protein [Candidatus Saccharimonadales bacterium]